MLPQTRNGAVSNNGLTERNVKLRSPRQGAARQGLGWTEAHLRQVIRDTIQIFWIQRTIFGSNFPLEKLFCSYADFIAAYKKVLSEYVPSEQKAVFHDNGKEFYRL